MSGMERIVSYGDLPASPSREQVLAVIHDPDFLGITVRVIEGVVIGLVTSIAALAVHRARNVVRANAAAEAERARIQRIFGRMCHRKWLSSVIQAGELAPQLQTASILFADIEGFTGLSESLPPARVIAMLNSFFGAATAIVGERGGVVVNYIGDALIAAFNAPLPAEDHRRGRSPLLAIYSLVSEREFEGHRLRIRIGVATGPVAAGTVGGGAPHA